MRGVSACVVVLLLLSGPVSARWVPRDVLGDPLEAPGRAHSGRAGGDRPIGIAWPPRLQEEPDTAAPRSGAPRVPKGGALLVRVVGALGAPVGGAEVMVTRSRNPEEVVVEGLTDGEGRCFIEDLPLNRTYEVTARAPGRAASRSSCSPTRRHPHRYVDLRLDDGAPLPVRIVDAVTGEALEGAHVVAWNVMVVPHDAYVFGRTNGEGRCVLEALPLGTVEFAAWIPSHGYARRSVRHLAMGKPHELRLQRGAGTTVEVVVEGWEGTRPEDARVHQSGPWLRRHQRQTWRTYPFLPAPEAMPAGEWIAPNRWRAVGLPEAVYVISPAAEGWAVSPDRRIIDTDGKNRELSFRARRTEELPPSPGHHVVLLSGTLRGGADDRGLEGRRLEFRPRGGGESVRVTTEEGGHFQVDLVLDARSTFWARLPDEDLVIVEGPGAPRENADERIRWHHGPWKVTDRSIASIVLRAERPLRVRGRVRAPEDTPLEGLRVELQAASREAPGAWKRVRTGWTDAEGSYVFQGPGSFRGLLRVRVTGCEWGGVSEPIAAVGERGILLPELGLLPTALRPAARIDGHVRDAEDRPLAGARVSVRRLGRGGLEASAFEHRSQLSNRDGEFSLRDLPPGRYEVQGRLVGADGWLQLDVAREVTLGEGMRLCCDLELEPALGW